MSVCAANVYAIVDKLAIGADIAVNHDRSGRNFYLITNADNQFGRRDLYALLSERNLDIS